MTINLLHDTSAVAATTVTDTNGTYTITGVIPDDYTIEIQPPPGYTPTTQDTGTGDTANLATGQTNPISVGPEDNTTTTQNDTSANSGINPANTITVEPGDTTFTIDAGLHNPTPAIAVNQSGPDTAAVGDTITNTIDVTNDDVTGDGSPIHNIVVTLLA